MTSLLRRKRQITARAIGATRRSRQVSVAVLATIFTSLVVAAAQADDVSTGVRRAKINPWPEDAAAQPVAKTVNNAPAAIKPGRNLVWRTAETPSTATTTEPTSTKVENSTKVESTPATSEPAQLVAATTKAATPISESTEQKPTLAVDPREQSVVVSRKEREPEATQVALKLDAPKMPTLAKPERVARAEPAKLNTRGTIQQTAEALPLPGRTETAQMPGMLPPGSAIPDEPPQALMPRTDYESCEEAHSKCDAAWERAKSKVLADIEVDLAPHPLAGNSRALQGRDYPCECVLPRSVFQPRCWQPSTYEWLASDLCYKPLYWEESSLERNGHTYHPLIQPFISGAHFFGTFPILPYKMGLETPCECIYPLGTYRPGDCAPRICDGIPLSIRGSLLEAGAWVGGAAAIP